MNTNHMWAAILLAFLPTFSFAEIVEKKKAIEVINTGVVVSNAVGSGSSYRDDKQAVYIVHEGVLYFCNLFTKKKRSRSEALVAVECFFGTE